MIDPVFILGNPRTGTSLLRVLLNSHDNIVIPPECGFIQWLYPKYNKFEIEKLDLFLNDLKITKKIEGWNLNYEKLENYLLYNCPKNYPELCFYIYKFYGETKNKNVKIWGDKNNYYVNHLDLISEVFPKAKFIYINRNPYDVIDSYLELNKLPTSKYKPDLPNNIESAFENWVTNNNKIFYFLSNSNHSYVNLQYENLISNPTKELNDIFKFLNICEQDVLKNFENRKYYDEPNITLAWKQKLNFKVDSFNKLKFINLSENNFIEIKNKLEQYAPKFEFIKF